MNLLARLVLGGLAAFVLAGCDTSGIGASLSFLESPENAQTLALDRADLAGGAITLEGPDGYCVDASTLRTSRQSGFAALASCNILSGGQTGPVVEPALVTVTVQTQEEATPSIEALAAALNTEVLSTRELSDISAGQMSSGGETAFDGSDTRHWRGVFELGGFVVGLALYAPEGSPLVGAQGAAFLNTVSSRIRAMSNPVERNAEQSQTTQDPITARLSRLFGNRDLQ